MGLFGNKERQEAKRLGIEAVELTKELPEFPGDGTVVLGPDRCVRYSIPRRSQEGPLWSLLQRTKETGATFPNEYLLTADKPLPLGLEVELRRIAEEYAEELFEFEGTASDVAVHWGEWGGVEKVRVLHGHLLQLANY
jgi:hypothetical protein